MLLRGESNHAPSLLIRLVDAAGGGLAGGRWRPTARGAVDVRAIIPIHLAARTDFCFRLLSHSLLLLFRPPTRLLRCPFSPSFFLYGKTAPDLSGPDDDPQRGAMNGPAPSSSTAANGRPNRPLVVKAGYDGATRRVQFPSAATARLESLHSRVSAS